MPGSLALPSNDPDFRPVDRFQSVSAGQYWRSKTALPDRFIDAGEVLLIEQLKWANDRVHTVVLRAHPLKYGRKPPGQSWGRLENHPFVLNEFLSRFEFEPDGPAVRAQEVGRVQTDIATLQSELLTSQRDPSILAGVIQDRLDTPAPAPVALDSSMGAALVDPAASAPIGEMTFGGAIQAGLQVADVDALRAQAQREHQIATIKADWIQEKTTAIADRVNALVPFFSEQAAAALAATEGVRSYVADLMRGIDSLDLYVGKGVTVTTLCEGAQAPADEPLSFIQKKLLMDEELAVWADFDASFDFESTPLFEAALREHPEFIEQVFPTSRCVLVMATTRRFIDYGNAFESAEKNDANRRVFLLVRNGDNVYRVDSPVESHLRSARLFPTKDEHEGVFRGLDGTTTRLEDVTYADRMAEHDLFALHYRRFVILCAGLDHRLGLFGKFYPGEPSMAFLSLPFQQTYCRFISDDDAAVQMAGPSARPSLHDWIEAQNAHLRSGSRVLCHWDALMTPHTAPAACEARSDRRSWKARPLSDAEIKIAYKSGSEICVETAVRRVGSDSIFNARVALTRYRPDDWLGAEEGLAFLVLDAVKIEDLKSYIHHRSSREHQVQYIRLFKRAVAFLEQEQVHQAPARAMLRNALLDGGIAEPQTCDELIDSAVMTWRAAQRGRELPSLGSVGADRVWRTLLDQMFALAKPESAPVAAARALATAAEEIPIRLSMTGQGRYALYSVAPGTDDRLEPFAWVRRSLLDLNSKGVAKSVSQSWVRLSRHDPSETVLHVWDEEAEALWCEMGSTLRAFESPQDKRLAFAAVDALPSLFAPWSSPMDEATFDREFQSWRSHHRELPRVCLPIALLKTKKQGPAFQLCLTENQAFVLGRLAPDASRRERVRRAFAEIYVREDLWRQTFDRVMQSPPVWDLALYPAHQRASSDLVRVDPGRSLRVPTTVDPLMSTRVSLGLSALRSEHKDLSVVFAPDLKRDLTALDTLLGLSRPADYAPTQILVATHRHDSNQPSAVVFHLTPFVDATEATSPRRDDFHSPSSMDAWTDFLTEIESGRGSSVLQSSYFATAQQAQAFIDAYRQVNKLEDFSEPLDPKDYPALPQAEPGVRTLCLLSPVVQDRLKDALTSSDVATIPLKSQPPPFLRGTTAP